MSILFIAAFNLALATPVTLTLKIYFDIQSPRRLILSSSPNVVPLRGTFARTYDSRVKFSSLSLSLSGSRRIVVNRMDGQVKRGGVTGPVGFVRSPGFQRQLHRPPPPIPTTTLFWQRSRLDSS